MDQDLSIPVIAIDGGAGTGKGTVRDIVAKRLGFHSLDSGVLYRAVAVVSLRKDIHTDEGFVEIAKSLNIRMDGEKVFIDEEEITEHIRTPDTDNRASEVAKVTEVRNALLNLQLQMRKLPGLVADGRDMGQIFDTPHKFHLHADIQERARRRVAQFAKKGIIVDHDEIVYGLATRDERDRNRAHNPLKSRKDAYSHAKVIDATQINAEEVADVILKHYLSKKKQ
jgi:cytidylate kinase